MSIQTTTPALSEAARNAARNFAEAALQAHMRPGSNSHFPAPLADAAAQKLAEALTIDAVQSMSRS